MIIAQYTVYGLFFLMELCALAAFSYWGFHLNNNNNGWFLKLLFGIGSPLLVAIFWGAFIAPKATFPVSIPIRICLQLIVFAFATAALYFSGKSKLAVIYGVVVLVGMILMYTIEEE